MGDTADTVVEKTLDEKISDIVETKGFLDTLATSLKSLLHPPEFASTPPPVPVPVPVPEPTVPTPITFFKQADGRTRWFSVVTNNYVDRTGDILTDAAHREYVAWVNETKAYPPLRLWHGGPESNWGTTDMVDYLDGFVVASGLIDPEKEFIADNLAKMTDLGTSHGFTGLKSAGKYVTMYRMFEISPLPLGAAANIGTSFDVGLSVKEITEMPFTDQRKTWFKEAGLDDATILRLEASVELEATKLKSMGLEYKGLTDPDPAAPNPALTDALNIITAQSEATTALATKVEEVITANKALTEKIEKMNTDVAAQVEDAFVAKISKAPGGFSATSSTENVVAEKQKESDMAWMGKVPMFAGLGAATAVSAEDAKPAS